MTHDARKQLFGTAIKRSTALPCRGLARFGRRGACAWRRRRPQTYGTQVRHRLSLAVQSGKAPRPCDSTRHRAAPACVLASANSKLSESFQSEKADARISDARREG